MYLSRLCDDIVATHHALLRREMPRLSAAFAEMGADPALTGPWNALLSTLDRHMFKEENILFPAIASLEAGGPAGHCGLQGPIKQMQHEHIEIRELEIQVRAAADHAGPEKDALLALLDDLGVHAGREDDALFPAALALAGTPQAGHSSPEPAAQACIKASAEHEDLRTAMALIDQRLADSEAGKPLLAPWTHLRRGLDEHFAAEEAQLFPAILALAGDEEPRGLDWISPLHHLQFELDEVRCIADALRNAARDAGPHEALLHGFLDRLEEHARTEEEELFPAAMALVDRWRARTSAPVALAEAPAPEATPPEPDAPTQPQMPTGRVVRTTEGRCSTCLKPVPASVVHRQDTIQLEKHCGEHGISRQLLSRSPDHWEELDRFYFQVNSESYPQRDFIVRMTETCNLDCPICLAKANTQDTPDLDLSGLENLLSQRRGIKVDLMAAEPTLREDLEEWIRRVKQTGNIAALHTNGLKLAKYEYARALRDAGLDEVFLQFDGFNEDANKVLRGRPLVKARTAALANLRKLGIATSLIVVIARGLNEEQVGEVYRFALQPQNDHIKEVFYLGLRMLGSARAAGVEDMALMPDELIELFTEQVHDVDRNDIHRFNKLYFAMLSAFRVKKCLYVQHYIVARKPPKKGGPQPVAQWLDLPMLERAAERYARVVPDHPGLARAALLADLARAGLQPKAARMLADLTRLQRLFTTGMNLGQVPKRFLLLGFITACDPHNFDAQVAINCGKGELSVDGGFVESGAVANVRREARFSKNADKNA